MNFVPPRRLRYLYLFSFLRFMFIGIRIGISSLNNAPEDVEHDSGADNPEVDSRSSSKAIIPKCLSFRQAAGSARGGADVVLVLGVAETETEAEEALNKLKLLVRFAALSDEIVDEPNDSSNDLFGERLRPYV